MNSVPPRKSNVIVNTGRDSIGLFVVLEEPRLGVTHVAGIPVDDEREVLDGRIYLNAGPRCSFYNGELVAVSQKDKVCV